MTARHPSIRWLTRRAGWGLVLAVFVMIWAPIAQTAQTKYLTAAQAKEKMNICFDSLSKQIDVLNNVEKEIEPAAKAYLTKAEFGITLRLQVDAALERLKAAASQGEGYEQSFQFLVQKIDNCHQVLPKPGEKAKKKAKK